MQNDKGDAVQPNGLPQKETPHKEDLKPHTLLPTDTISALNKEQQKPVTLLNGKQADSINSAEDINEQFSDGSASAFGEFIDNAEKNTGHLN